LKIYRWLEVNSRSGEVIHMSGDDEFMDLGLQAVLWIIEGLAVAEERLVWLRDIAEGAEQSEAFVAWLPAVAADERVPRTLPALVHRLWAQWNGRSRRKAVASLVRGLTRAGLWQIWP
jgi:hypothetical protein